MNSVKKNFVWCVVAFLCGFGTATKAQNAAADGDPAFLDYKGDFHKEVIAPQVRAWQKVAKVSFPNVCDDTENQWAVMMVDSIAEMILANPDMPKGEQLAHLYEMENYAAYGMSYLFAILGYHIAPEATQDALAIVPDTEKLLQEMRENGFKDVQQFLELENSVYLNYCLFIFFNTRLTDGSEDIFNNMISANQFNAGAIGLIIQSLKNDIQLYRNSAYIFSNSFYLTFCPMAFWLGGPEFSNGNMDEYLEIGNWIDSHEVPIINALNEGLPAPEISLDEYSAFLKQVSEYRARLIELLATAIENLPMRQNDDEE